MLYILFRLCCGIITLISYCTGFTYEEVNSILFIYGEPIVIGLCNLFILFKSFNHKLLCVLITLYNIFYLFVISKIFIHYIPYSLHNACVVAYKDLETLGSITGFGYVGINLFLFIILPLLLVNLNIIFYAIIKRNRNKKTQTLS